MRPTGVMSKKDDGAFRILENRPSWRFFEAFTPANAVSTSIMLVSLLFLWTGERKESQPPTVSQEGDDRITDSQDDVDVEVEHLHIFSERGRVK